MDAAAVGADDDVFSVDDFSKLNNTIGYRSRMLDEFCGEFA